MNSKYVLWAGLMSLIETKASVVGWALPTISFLMMLFSLILKARMVLRAML
jgi:hypothetical protein